MNTKTTYYSLTLVDHTYVRNEEAVVPAASETDALKIANRLFKDFEGNYGRVERTTVRDYRAFMKRLEKKIRTAKHEAARLEKLAAALRA